MDEFITIEVDENELLIDIEHKKYFIKFKNYENNFVVSEIPEDVFNAYIESKRQIKRGKNEVERHWERNSITENALYNRALNYQQSTEEIIIEKERNKKIHNTINNLRKAQKEKIVKYYFDNKTEEEIAKEENMSQPAISKGLELAKRNFKKEFLKKNKKF